MSSTSRGPGARASSPGWIQRALWVALGGVLWGQGALAIGSILLPRYLVYGESVKHEAAYRVVASTALVPWTVAGQIARFATGAEGTWLAPKFVVAVAAPLLGCLLVAGFVTVGRSRARRVAVTVLGILALTASVALALQLADTVRAEREFFAMVSAADEPHRAPGVVAGAGRFLAKHPHSRWRSEAIRIQAMAAEEAGDEVTAQSRWREFANSFDDASVPGVAYAEYSRARCWERLGASRRAATHYRRATAVIRGRSDGIQSWIGSQGAVAVARRELALGRPIRAAFWSDTANDISATGRD